ncbi:MAG: lipopolysaccharide biosynthesis protein RfbH [Methanobrevibacter sp.]|jgi:CDP-6-deoxy-D-xylo-4-hexulose-3-dehydrase|nr:lipopolysaccharide biosynthesis protein RfbH [Candidatus Methanoflexus mossambicus]
MEIGSIIKFKSNKKHDKSDNNYGIIVAQLNDNKLLISTIHKNEIETEYSVLLSKNNIKNNFKEDIISEINFPFYCNLNDLDVVFINSRSNIGVDYDDGDIEVLAILNDDILEEILRKFVHYSSYQHYNFNQSKNQDKKYIPPSGKVLDENDLFKMVDASLDMWLTAGRFDNKFCESFAQYLNRNYVLTVNSGSSANLLAISALKSSKLGEKQLCDGDEVITVAAGFPTTVAPIVQNNLIPVFVDVDIGTYNIDVSKIEKSLTEKTKAIFIAHTLGNPFDLEKIMEIAEKHDLWVIEDNCDALGSKFKDKNGDYKLTGTFGHISTFSFYPAHHITMGEGGAISTDNDLLYQILLSLRDWGRDCYCKPGTDNSCGMRFSRQFGLLPWGYDHKYVYSHFGYNLKITDWQAAIGLSQLNKLDDFTKRRKENFEFLKTNLSKFEDYLILPYQLDNCDASWFGFTITVKVNNDFRSKDLVKFLEDNGIGTRQLFAGNILRQPLFVDGNVDFRIEDSEIFNSSNISEDLLTRLSNTEDIIKNTFWIAVYPGLNNLDLNKIIQIFELFFGKLVI